MTSNWYWAWGKVLEDDGTLFVGMAGRGDTEEASSALAIEGLRNAYPNVTILNVCPFNERGNHASLEKLGAGEQPDNEVMCALFEETRND